MFKFIGLLFVLIALFVGYTFFVLNWSYSVGDRAGYVQKFSKKGWVCKTWEGEIALVSLPGTVAEKFYFTVKDEELAKKINDSLGQRMVLEYEEHVGIPNSCFGDTGYYVIGIKEISPGSQGL